MRSYLRTSHHQKSHPSMRSYLRTSHHQKSHPSMRSYLSQPYSLKNFCHREMFLIRLSHRFVRFGRWGYCLSQYRRGRQHQGFR